MHPKNNYTEIEVPAVTIDMLPPHKWVKAYKKDDLAIIISLENPDGYHLSVSHANREARMNELIQAREALLPRDVVMNIGAIPGSDPNILHMWELKKI